MTPQNEIEEAALRKYQRRQSAAGAIPTEPADAEVTGDIIELYNVKGVLSRYKILSDEPGKVRLSELEIESDEE